MHISRQKKPKPISKEKVKEALDIMDVAYAFSGQINTRPKQPSLYVHSITIGTWVPAVFIQIRKPSIANPAAHTAICLSLLPDLWIFR